MISAKKNHRLICIEIQMVILKNLIKTKVLITLTINLSKKMRSKSRRKGEIGSHNPLILAPAKKYLVLNYKPESSTWKQSCKKCVKRSRKHWTPNKRLKFSRKLIIIKSIISSRCMDTPIVFLK